jgi:flagellar secretion chaperone FliS
MAVETASKETILLMLYEGCILNLKKCKIAMEQKNYSDKGLYLGKAQDIVNELTNSLNFSVGGDLSRHLEGLYLHIFEQTTKANIENDPVKIEHCIKIMETLHSGWKEAIDKLKGGGNGGQGLGQKK